MDTKEKSVHRSPRRSEISAQNVMYCLFVLVIHLLTPALLSHTWVFLFQRILFCAIFGFIFLAGVKSTLNGGKKSLAVYYKGRVLRVVLPYLVATALYMCAYRIFDIPAASALGVGDYFSYAVCGNLTSHFYFVIALLQLYLITPAVTRAVRRFGCARALAVSLAASLCTALFFNGFSFYNRMFTRYLFCYVCGCCVGLNYDSFSSKIKKYRITITSAFVPLLVAELALALLFRRALISATLQQVFTMIYMPAAVLFVFCVFVGARSQETRLSQNRFLALLDRESYFIYLYHVLALQLADKLLSEAPAVGNVAYFCARCAMCAALLAVMLALKLSLEKASRSARRAFDKRDVRL